MYKHQIIKITDKNYPSLLREIKDPPERLFVRGILPDFTKAVSIVGARKYTEYGRNVTKDLAQAAAMAGIPVVSGLAYGIDAIAHEATLAAKGITVAVLPCDISGVYPTAHESLARRIVESGGAIISEMPIPTRPQKHHFLIRNRIIAGLTRMTIVVEAAARSGALATARCAFSYQRPVIAVPGSIYSLYSAGTNRLITQGAGIILSADDMLRELGVSRTEQIKHRYDEQTMQLLQAIPRRGITLERLAEVLSLDFVEISSKVILLEINGLVAQVGEGIYRRLV